MHLESARVVVVGLAQTGIATARFCASRGARVVVTDAKPASALEAQIAALRGAAELELGGHDEATFRAADLVVVSPGVPEIPPIRAARAAGVEVIAEIELAYRCLHPQANLIAITGTNGKSTTTSLTGSLCRKSGRPTFCGGNLGNAPLIDAVGGPADTPGGLVVAEVAGFMLETCAGFRPKVAVCLNITEDHLDRYKTMEVYAGVKTRVFRWQREDDAAIANAACELSSAGARVGRAQTYLFDRRGEVGRGAFLSPDRQEIVLRIPSGEERYPASDLPIVGTHNLENAMAAYLAARLAGVSSEAVRAGARAFRPEPHRMELVGHFLGDIAVYDDSKGTNVAAVAASVRGFPRKVVLIAGGVDKGGSYAPLFEALAPVARGLVLLGEAAELIERAAHEHAAGPPAYPIERARDMDDAVRRAAALAREGDAVMLSPACSSYDMFSNFQARGMAFRAAAVAAGAVPAHGESPAEPRGAS
jgi:UDP-N-acetylmuramoylalanine--D-glutamate ligase